MQLCSWVGAFNIERGVPAHRVAHEGHEAEDAATRWRQHCWCYGALLRQGRVINVPGPRRKTGSRTRRESLEVATPAETSPVADHRFGRAKQHFQLTESEQHQ